MLCGEAWGGISSEKYSRGTYYIQCQDITSQLIIIANAPVGLELRSLGDDRSRRRFTEIIERDNRPAVDGQLQVVVPEECLSILAINRNEIVEKRPGEA